MEKKLVALERAFDDDPVKSVNDIEWSLFYLNFQLSLVALDDALPRIALPRRVLLVLDECSLLELLLIDVQIGEFQGIAIDGQAGIFGLVDKAERILMKILEDDGFTILLDLSIMFLDVILQFNEGEAGSDALVQRECLDCVVGVADC